MCFMSLVLAQEAQKFGYSYMSGRQNMTAYCSENLERLTLNILVRCSYERAIESGRELG
jgi:hypothetical protein